MVAQDDYTKAGVIAESSNFDNFSNVKGRILPVDATASVVGIVCLFLCVVCGVLVVCSFVSEKEKEEYRQRKRKSGGGESKGE